MEDLTRLLPGDPVSALAGGCVMDAGGQVFDTSEAQTAPGTMPVATPGRNVQAYGPPRIGTSPLSDRPNLTTGTAYEPSPVTWKETSGG